LIRDEDLPVHQDCPATSLPLVGEPLVLCDTN
jgi:hypothetical protein